MSKFNTVKENTRITKNQAGGVAYKQSSKLELASLLVTSMLAGDKAYETESDLVTRLVELYKTLNAEDKTFFAKASIYARDKFRLRSISHLCSAILAEGVVMNNYTEEDKKWLKSYFSKVIMRADDITETISAYASRPNAYKSKAGRVQLPSVVKKGLSLAMANYDEYIMAKYKQESKTFSLVDAVNMCHTKATEKNATALKNLVEGTLKSADTWQVKQTQAGKAENKEKAKKEAWAEFLAKGERIEYFALLRNLRNIVETGDNNLISQAATLLSNEKLVKNSRVLPFRFLTAYEIIKETGSRKLQQALNKAVEISLSNVPEFSGKTALLVDVSGSMGAHVGNGNTRVIDIAALFAAVLFKTNDSTIIPFGEQAYSCKPNPDDSIFTIAGRMRACDGGTNMSAGFEALKEKYDRVIVLSDMQTWLDKGSSWYYRRTGTNELLKQYRKEYNPDCKLYCFDLTGNGTMQFPEENVACIAGFSEQVFSTMGKLEEDKQAMIHEIEAIEL